MKRIYTVHWSERETYDVIDQSQAKIHFSSGLLVWHGLRFDKTLPRYNTTNIKTFLMKVTSIHFYIMLPLYMQLIITIIVKYT